MTPRRLTWRSEWLTALMPGWTHWLLMTTVRDSVHVTRSVGLSPL